MLEKNLLSQAATPLEPPNLVLTCHSYCYSSSFGVCQLCCAGMLR
uniref:Uncharacterized protein n=1 Tax=Aegilops tauschii subsp. strangulata TaxID=200361 RepID=A0A453C4V1_AEGTS